MTEENYEKKAGNGCVAELFFEGRMTRRQLEFLAESVKKYKIRKTTLNRCGNVVVWNLRREILTDFLAEAEGADIVCKSAYDREKVSVRCAPLSGVEEGECFDVFPYAGATRRWLRDQVFYSGQNHAAGDAVGGECPFTIGFFNVPRLPVKEKACDLSFCAAADGLFDVWVSDPAGKGRSCRNAEDAVFHLAGRVEPGRFLSYIKTGLAIHERANTADEYRSLFWQTMAALPDEERQPVTVEATEITKTGTGNFTCGPRVVRQKQEDLYAVRYHPLGGVVNVAFWQKLLRAVEKIEDVEFRLDFRTNLYVCNLLAEETGLLMDSMSDGAFTAAEASPVHSFCGLCARANCDAQMFEHVFLKELKKLGFGGGTLPTFTVAGCPDACGDISDVDLRFLAEMRQMAETADTDPPQTQTQAKEEKVKAAEDLEHEKTAAISRPGKNLLFTVESRDGSGSWRPIGRIPQQQLTEYLIALGALPQSAGMTFKEWREANSGLLEKVTDLYSIKGE